MKRAALLALVAVACKSPESPQSAPPAPPAEDKALRAKTKPAWVKDGKCELPRGVCGTNSFTKPEPTPGPTRFTTEHLRAASDLSSRYLTLVEKAVRVYLSSTCSTTPERAGKRREEFIKLLGRYGDCEWRNVAEKADDLRVWSEGGGSVAYVGISVEEIAACFKQKFADTRLESQWEHGFGPWFAANATKVADTPDEIPAADSPAEPKPARLMVGAAPPTTEDLQAFLAGGVSAKWLSFTKAGTGTLYDAYAAEAAANDECECDTPGKVTPAAGQLALSCRYICTRHPSQQGGPEPSYEVTAAPKSFTLKALFASKDALLVKNGDDRILVWGCSPSSDTQCWARTCRSVNVTRDRHRLFQIIPGAADRTLYDAVRAKLQEELDEWPLFEGQPAKNPRETTEVYYVDPQATTRAQDLARNLYPIIGEVTLKQWEGASDYDLILVVGATKGK